MSEQRYIGITDREAEQIIAYQNGHQTTWRLRGHTGYISHNRETVSICNAQGTRRRYSRVFERDIEELEVKVKGRYRKWVTIKDAP